MYRLAVATLDRFARENAGSARGRRLGWGAGIKARDILFLDEIGQNLREARVQDMRLAPLELLMATGLCALCSVLFYQPCILCLQRTIAAEPQASPFYI